MNNLIRGQYSEKVCEKAWPFAVVASLAVTSVATWNFTRSSEVNADENGSNAKIKNVIVLIGWYGSFIYDSSSLYERQSKNF